MALNVIETTNNNEGGDGTKTITDTKTSSKPNIRDYLVKTSPPSSASAPSTPKPLTSSHHDNITKNVQNSTKQESVSRSASTPNSNSSSSSNGDEGVMTDFLKRMTSKSRVEASLNQVRPGGLKRSHSAISVLDTANEQWLHTQLTSKQKTCEKREAYDRLAPNIADMPSAQVIMNKTTTTSLDNNGSESYQEQVAKACGLIPNQRILSFSPSPPTSKKVDLRINQPSSLKHTISNTAEAKRRILTSPEKILDAPYMADDYYLNLLDWSANNIVAVGLGSSVYLWNADNGSIQALNYDYDDAVASVNWSGDGTYLAVGTTSGDTQIWDVQHNTKLRSMQGQDCRIGVLSWDKHLVSSGGRDGSIWHHDVRMAKHNVKELYGHQDDVCGLKWRWDGEMLVSGGNDNTVNIWDARSTTPRFTKRVHIGAVKALAWCPWNRNVLATGGGRDDKKIHFWNTSTGSRVNTIITGSQVTSLHWSQHYKEIASTHGLPHNQVTVWGYPTLNKIVDIPAHESRILHSAMSPDGQVLATAAADENLKFWRIFEANGKAPLGTESTRLTEKKHLEFRRSRSIR